MTIQDAVDNHESLRQSWHWDRDQGNAQIRARREKELNFTVEEEIDGHMYSYTSRVQISRQRFYYKGEFTRDGVKGDVRLFKKLLQEEI
jgi:hypothetical protein